MRCIQANTTRHTSWTDVYKDAATGEPVVTISVPVYDPLQPCKQTSPPSAGAVDDRDSLPRPPCAVPATLVAVAAMDVAVVAVSGQVTQALAQSPAVLDGGLGVVFDSQTGALLGSTNEVSPPFPPAQHHLCPLSMTFRSQC